MTRPIVTWQPRAGRVGIALTGSLPGQVGDRGQVRDAAGPAAGAADRGPFVAGAAGQGGSGERRPARAVAAGGRPRYSPEYACSPLNHRLPE